MMYYSIQDGFPYYIELVGERDYRLLFSSFATLKLIENLTEDESRFRHEPGKWSIKQVVGHITDYERIMMYRILRFSRKDTTLLPGYDQNEFVDNSRFDEILFRDLVEDYIQVRKASISFMNMLSNEQLQLKGKAWKFELTVEDFLKATIGHELHHIDVLKTMYLPNFNGKN